MVNELQRSTAEEVSGGHAVVMGNANQTPEKREARLHSAVIDWELRQSTREYENTIKIIVLGMW